MGFNIGNILSDGLNFYNDNKNDIMKGIDTVGEVSKLFGTNQQQINNFKTGLTNSVQEQKNQASTFYMDNFFLPKYLPYALLGGIGIVILFATIKDK